MDPGSCLRFGPSFLGSLSSPSHKAYNFGKEAFSVEAWIKSLNGGPIIARKPQNGGTNCGGWSLSVQPGEITFMTDNGYASSSWHTRAGSGHACDGGWHHIAAVRDGANAHIYLDGSEILVDRSGPGNPPLDVNCGEQLTIGTSIQTQQFLTGYLAEIRIWNVARSLDDILLDLYRRFGPADTTGQLVGYWPGDFGLTIDFSATRNATDKFGSSFGAEKAPFLSVGADDDFWTLFSGVYNTFLSPLTTKSQTIIISPLGFAIYGESTILEGVKLAGTTLSWPSGGKNPFSAVIDFAMYSDNTAFWPEPQQQALFEGSITIDGAVKPYKGLISPHRLGPGTLLNIGTGQIMRCAGSAAGVDSYPMEFRQQFCRYGIGGIMCEDTNLALVPENSSVEGSKVILVDPGMDKAGLAWLFQDDGTVLAADNSNMALSVGTQDHVGGIRPVVLAKANSSDINQQWISLSDSRPIQLASDAQNRVMASMDDPSGHGIGIAVRADDSPEQSWYVVGQSFLCGANMLAIVAVGNGVSGEMLSLAPWVPGDPRQEFSFDGWTLKHTASGLVVVADTTTGSLVLASAAGTWPNSYWDFSSAPPPGYLPERSKSKKKWVAMDASRKLVHPQLPEALTGSTPPSGNTTYVVTIITANAFCAGTDDRVSISLSGTFPSLSTGLIELSNSATHDDPFERAQSDTFILEDVPDVGAVTRVMIQFAYNAVVFADEWEIAAISVINTKWHTTSAWGWVRSWKPEDYMRGYIMRRWARETFSLLVGPEPEYKHTMSLCRAPAQDKIGKFFGWDHVWIEVSDRSVTPPKDLTYFDCAGGHGEGIPQTKVMQDVKLASCNLNNVVRMATGSPIDPKHPPCYGTGRTDGVENANVRTDGMRNRGGTCHQIANRYLWTCYPSTYINMRDQINRGASPRGYNLSIMMWGVYGVDFGKWVSDHGFGDPIIFPYLTAGRYIRDICDALDWCKELTAYILNLQNDLAKSKDQRVDGPEVKAFLKKLRKRKTIQEIAELLDLTAEDVRRLSD